MYSANTIVKGVNLTIVFQSMGQMLGREESLNMAWKGL